LRQEVLRIWVQSLQRRRAAPRARSLRFISRNTSATRFARHVLGKFRGLLEATRRARDAVLSRTTGMNADPNEAASDDLQRAQRIRALGRGQAGPQGVRFGEASTSSPTPKRAAERPTKIFLLFFVVLVFLYGVGLGVLVYFFRLGGWWGGGGGVVLGGGVLWWGGCGVRFFCVVGRYWGCVSLNLFWLCFVWEGFLLFFLFFNFFFFFFFF